MNKVYVFMVDLFDREYNPEYVGILRGPDEDIHILIKEFKRAMYEPIGGKIVTTGFNNYRRWEPPANLKPWQLEMAKRMSIPVFERPDGTYAVNSFGRGWKERFLLWLIEERGFEIIPDIGVEVVDITGV